ncbi:MAG: tetratricopeptide repeat protein [Planctomycetota bacterium]
MLTPPPLPRTTVGVAAALLVALSGLLAQEQVALSGPAAAPAGEAGSDAVSELLAAGEQALLAEDPVRSWRAFQAAAVTAREHPGSQVGLGRSHLLLGRAAEAIAYADCVLLTDPGHQLAMALAVRARIRAREFEPARLSAERFVARCANPSAELLAAQGSALFRVQRTDEAAAVYRDVLRRDPLHAEAHLRLGSGLSAPCTVTIDAATERAVAAMRAGRLVDAIAALRRVLAADGANPVAHRLLGEALLQQQALASMALRDPAFLALRARWPVPDTATLPIAEFVPGYRELDGDRRAVVDRAMALFGSRLQKLLVIGGRHDLLLETERTTDADARASLRGRRTFDGRVWDDVRGIGGLKAATGIEALDEAAQFGFDTLVHEIAHQVHYFGLRPVDRARITALYRKAIREGRCLDYYAATNEAEYFGQGVEAFASLCKRPGGETTHGHTRFELYRTDPELHDFIQGIVDRDPLQGPERVDLLRAAIAVALRCGRPDDAVAAASMLPQGAEREQLLRAAEDAATAARSH